MADKIDWEDAGKYFEENVCLYGATLFDAYALGVSYAEEMQKVKEVWGQENSGPEAEYITPGGKHYLFSYNVPGTNNTVKSYFSTLENAQRGVELSVFLWDVVGASLNLSEDLIEEREGSLTVESMSVMSDGTVITNENALEVMKGCLD